MKHKYNLTLDKILQNFGLKKEKSINVIMIGHPDIGVLSHIHLSDLGTVMVCDIDENRQILFPKVTAQDLILTDFDRGFYQHLVNETNQSLCLIAKEVDYMAECEYEEKNQPIKNYDLPKVGRLNTNPKIIWWHKSHQRK